MGAKVIIFDKILNYTFLKGLRHSAMTFRSFVLPHPEHCGRDGREKEPEGRRQGHHR